MSTVNSYSPYFVYRNNKKAYYSYDDQLYCPTFPLEWAMDHHQNTGPKECKNCAYFGSHLGVFVGYCLNCAQYEYETLRGKGLIKASSYGPLEELDSCEGESIFLDTYMKGVDLNEIGDPDFNPSYLTNHEDTEYIEGPTIAYVTEETEENDESKDVEQIVDELSDTLFGQLTSSNFGESGYSKDFDELVEELVESLFNKETTETKEEVCDIGCEYKDVLEELPVSKFITDIIEEEKQLDLYDKEIEEREERFANWKWKIYESPEFYSSSLLNENDLTTEEEDYSDLPELIPIQEEEEDEEEDEDEEDEEG
jgi:hypothetical protein